MESVMIVTTPPSRGIKSKKKKRVVEEASPSTDAVSEKNLKETAPMVLARWKTMAYKGNPAARRLAEVLVEMEASTNPGMEEDGEGECKKGFYQWTDVANRRWPGLDLNSTPECGEIIDE